MAFTSPFHASSSSTRSSAPTTTILYSTTEQPAETTTTTSTVLSLSLEKPLGMILEEVTEGEADGVYVLELNEDGSAASCADTTQIVGSKVLKVMETDVSTMTFDDVMDQLINAPSPVNLELLPKETTAEKEEKEEESTTSPAYEVGTTVTLTVKVEGQDDIKIDGKVGDNLRQTLIDNGVEVYRGFKAKIGNCGGGGQCGFCAVDFVDSEGWEERSDYEAKKINKNRPTARLACLNLIQGPVTIQM